MKAPDFTLQDEAGVQRSLHDWRGRWVILYVYPRDDTPACTKEACAFRDTNEALLAKDAVVVGISRDTVQSHAKFKAKHELPFTLLSDPDHATIEAYGAWGPAFMGHIGTQRKTFIIDPEGNIIKDYPKVTPAQHATQILNDLVELQSR
jgi:peroxiredoxin Q/BCP